MPMKNIWKKHKPAIVYTFMLVAGTLISYFAATGWFGRIALWLFLVIPVTIWWSHKINKM